MNLAQKERGTSSQFLVLEGGQTCLQMTNCILPPFLTHGQLGKEQSILGNPFLIGIIQGHGRSQHLARLIVGSTGNERTSQPEMCLVAELGRLANHLGKFLNSPDVVLLIEIRLPDQHEGVIHPLGVRMLAQDVCTLENSLLEFSGRCRTCRLYKEWQVLLTVHLVLEPIQIIVALFKLPLCIVERVVVSREIAVATTHKIRCLAT